jgi:hypothetical protein
VPVVLPPIHEVVDGRSRGGAGCGSIPAGEEGRWSAAPCTCTWRQAGSWARAPWSSPTPCARWGRRWGPAAGGPPTKVAALCAERPTRGRRNRPAAPGARWSARRPPSPSSGCPAGPGTAAEDERPCGRALAGRVVLPPGGGIGRTRTGAGSRPRRADPGLGHPVQGVHPAASGCLSVQAGVHPLASTRVSSRPSRYSAHRTLARARCPAVTLRFLRFETSWEVVPALVEVEVAVPHLSPAVW